MSGPLSGCAPTPASPPSPIVDGPIANGFALSGVSCLPDPATHAYRKDLADTALAGRVIASHYAEPLLRHVVADAAAYSAPASDGDPIATVASGAVLRMLDCSRGWAWGYLPDGRVGYLPASAVRI